jgi:two-component system sensor histidine kinase/response regulator
MSATGADGRLRDRVLVVDDSQPNRLVACGHLEAAGYEVATADSGEAALELLAREPFDLVVLDVLMPGMGGFDTCRRMRAAPDTANIPVLFLTALEDKDTTVPALAAGGDDLLGKPFHRAELLLRIGALIRQRRTTDELRGALASLVERNERLQRIERDRVRMSQLIVHDLKGPLGSVLANSQLIRTQLAASNEPRDRELVELIDDVLIGVTQLDRTARDLVDLARADDAALIPDPEAFDFALLLHEVIAALRGLARSYRVGFELAVDVATIRADRELVRRTLQNLVHNAIVHSPPDGVIRVEATREDRGVVVRVLDDGPGVTASDAERIFDPYVSTASSRKSGGHGLGLAFCRLAVEAHQGAIWVEPRVPRGAAFCVRLPQAP